jgi:4-diphosphocytidyl-2-C-methyl-D-erythritol kinase
MRCRRKKEGVLRSKVVMQAPAKINLYLEVGPLRHDGFHVVRTVLQTVDLCDLVEVEVVDGGEGIALAVEGEAPLGEDNLCHRAASAFLAATGLHLGIEMRLTKVIPPAAGLGGGSADAAAVLRALNFFTGEALSRGDLLRTAASLGSDVPFFLVGGTALGEGRGERITPLAQAPPLPAVLANPGMQLSTAEVYSRFDSLEEGEPPQQGPGELIEELARGDVGRVTPLLFNALQPAACDLMPEVASLLDEASRAGAAGALVSGSGPSVFLLAAGDDHAEALEKQMKEAAPLVWRTRFRSAGVSPPQDI